MLYNSFFLICAVKPGAHAYLQLCTPSSAETSIKIFCLLVSYTKRKEFHHLLQYETEISVLKAEG